ncbi:MAG: radical SAM protein, partial [Candidatus Odinarchaeia archaeon]
MIKNGSDGRLIFKLDVGNICNNYCLFCYQNFYPKHFLPLSLCRKLLNKYRKERDLLIISGGEPTLFPDLFELIRYARKELNYEHTQLETNTRMFSYPEYTNRFLKLLEDTKPVIPEYVSLRTDFSFRVSIYSHKQNIHDLITQVPGSFKQTVKGIENLLISGQEVVSNTVISSLNYRELDETAKFLFRLGITSQEYSFIHDAKDKNYRKFTIKYSKFKPYLEKLLACIKKLKKVSVFIENIPFCFMRDNEVFISDNHYVLGKYRRLRYYAFPGKIKKEEYKRGGCLNKEKCKYEFICRGIDQKYIKTYGWSEFKPVNYKKSKGIFNERNLEFLKNSEFNVISHLSGGIDSKCATALFAKNNLQRKILLITYDNGCI